jgi:hypothetical protein
MGSIRGVAGLVVLALLLNVVPQVASAQSFNLDARKIGLGGSNNSMAAKVIAEHQPYTVIPVPLGLFQLVRNTKYFDPDDPNFDPARAIEYAGNPMHFTFDRNQDSAGHRFVNDLVNGNFSADLNAYRGFKPSPEISAGGLFTPSWGKAFRVKGDKNAGTSHGIYVGVGPYLSLGTSLAIDPKLIALFASPTPTFTPNQSFLTTDTTTGQAAVALTGGYRVRFEVPGLSKGGGSTTNRQTGLHIAANYNYLYGLHYEDSALNFQFSTDANGLASLNSPNPNTPPLSVNRIFSQSGHGFSLDLATALVTDHWDVSVGVDGIGNRINWTKLSSRQYVMNNLFNGSGFVTMPGLPVPGEREVKLPVRVSGAGSYYTDKWSAAAELGRDLQKHVTFNMGGEYWLGPLAVRGGTRYSQSLWHAATGIGFNPIKKIGIDIAAFQNTANIEEDHRMSLAVSLRINHEKR